MDKKEEISPIIEPKKEVLTSNPFIGLRPFEIEESHLFFGREDHCDEVLLKLLKNRFIAIMGSSGSGKSSLIKCGVVPKLYSGLYTNNEYDWEVILTKPGTSPIKNLADAILSVDQEYANLDEQDKAFRSILSTTILKSSSLGLIDLFKQFEKLQNKNIFLLIDQFEELLRYKKGEDINEVIAFINLILESVYQLELPVYIAITIRSDYSGNLTKFPELTRLINDSHYLIPKMTREQRREAIEGPIAVQGGKIAPRLVQQLLNDAENDEDQLPIIQHALMRTWNYWVENRSLNELIDLKHYEAIGTITEAISQHANEIYEDLSDEEKKICETLFKTITEKGNDDYGVRKPARIDLIAAIAGVEEAKLIKVVELFRQSGNSLLMTQEGGDLDSDSIIDVSHESLIRIWGRLHRWVEEEHNAIETYLRLCEAADKYQQGLTTLWRPPDLQLALNWQQKYRPTLLWAQNYDPAFERAMVFLRSSRQAHETEQKNKEARQQKRLRTTKILSLVFGVIAIFSILLMVYGFSQQLEAQRQKQEADNQRDQAIYQKNLADSLRIYEEKLKRDAIQSQNEAEDQKNEAKRQELIAIAYAKSANEQAELAENRRKEAVEARQYSEKQEIEARIQRDEANRQTNIAEDRQREAYRLRLLSIAKTMAVKSIEIDDKNLKGLLALQAYQFNSEYDGDHYDYDIFRGLYHAYKLVKGDFVNRLIGHSGSIRSLVFNSQGDELYTAGGDGKVLRWSLDKTFDQSEQIADYGRHDTYNRVLTISPNDRWLVCAYSTSNMEIYDLQNLKKKPKTIDLDKGYVSDMVYLNDNSGFITVTSDSLVRFYDHNNSKDIYKVPSKVTSIAANNNGSVLAVAYEDGKVEFTYLKDNFKREIIYSNDFKSIQSLAFSNDGKFLAIGESGGIVKVWDIPENRIRITLTGFNAPVSDLEFSFDDKMLAAASFNREVRIWFTDRYNLQPIILDDHDDWVWSIAFSRDGKELMVGCVSGLIRRYPIDPTFLADRICEDMKRNLSPPEWYQYVDVDIEYNFTCPGLPIGNGTLDN